MIYSIGSMKNIPADFNLNSIPDYFKTNVFTTSVGFRCYYPSLVNNYPIEENGILYINRSGNMLKMYFFTKNATYISVGLYIGNTIRKIDWYQVIDGRHNSIYDNANIGKKLVTDSDVKKIVDTFLTKYDDTELWRMIEPKFKKDEWNGYANSANPHIRRGNNININTDRGIVIKGSNVVISKDRGLMVQSPSGSSMRAWVGGSINLYGNHQNSITAIGSDRKLVVQSRNRPIVQSNDAGGGNREIVIRADVRWKQMYNGRQGLRSIAYPAHAKEVIVQLYTDVGGRSYIVKYPETMISFGIRRNDNGNTQYISDRPEVDLGIRGKAGHGTQTARQRGYKEFAPMHFVKGLYNRINQDSAIIEHHGNATITISSIGLGNVIDGRSYSAAAHPWYPINEGIAVVDNQFVGETNLEGNTKYIRHITNQDTHSRERYNERGVDAKIVLRGASGRLYDTNYIWSENIWRTRHGHGSPDGDIPYIRRVWWR